MKNKLRIKKGDLVEAIAGEDATGKHGKVLQVMPAQDKVLVEGFNHVKKHIRPTQDNPQGGVVEKEAPIHISNLKLHEPAENKGRAKKSAKS